MVMPCSRSASRPSVSSEKVDGLAGAGAPGRPSGQPGWRWLSNSRLPISVLLLSSTLPAVRNRRARCWRVRWAQRAADGGCPSGRASSPTHGVSSVARVGAAWGWSCRTGQAPLAAGRLRASGPQAQPPPRLRAFLLAALHRGIRGAVVHARGAALAHRHRQRLATMSAVVPAIAFHRAGAGHVAHGAEAHVRGLDGSPACGGSPRSAAPAGPCGGSPGARARSRGGSGMFSRWMSAPRPARSSC